MAALTEDIIQTVQSAAKLLTGYRRRQFQAEMAVKYCNGSARQAETVFGWGRVAVETGLNERRTGIRCVDAANRRGRKKTEERCPKLEDHIHRLVDPQAQADPKFQTTLAFTRVTAKAVREALQAEPELHGSVPAARPSAVSSTAWATDSDRSSKPGPKKNPRNRRDLRQRPRRPRPSRRRP